MSRVIPMSHINAFFTNKKLRPLSLGNTAFLRLKKGALFKKDLSLSISRVLSCTVIYLGLPSPISSSDIHGIPPDGQPYMADTQSCSEWGLHGILRYRSIGELLPRLSILTGKTLRFISVALSLKSPSPDVIRHPVLCCSDFPHGINAPRPYNKLKSFIIIALFLKKITFCPLLFTRKRSKIYINF